MFGQGNCRLSLIALVCISAINLFASSCSGLLDPKKTNKRGQNRGNENQVPPGVDPDGNQPQQDGEQGSDEENKTPEPNSPDADIVNLQCSSGVHTTGSPYRCRLGSADSPRLWTMLSNSCDWLSLKGEILDGIPTSNARPSCSVFLSSDASAGEADKSYSLIRIHLENPPKAVTTQIDTGNVSCAIQTPDSALYCWGNGDFGQNGAGLHDYYQPQTKPLRIFPSGVSSVSVSGNHVCAIHGGDVKCWGYNFGGAIGNGRTTGTELTPVTALSGPVTKIVSNPNSSAYGPVCAIKGGDLYCWGPNRSGEAGVDSLVDVGTPTQTSKSCAHLFVYGKCYRHTRNLRKSSLTWSRNTTSSSRPCSTQFGH